MIRAKGKVKSDWLMKRQLLTILFSISYFLNFSQASSISKRVGHVDSVVELTNQQNIIPLRECDSITSIEGHKAYKCWNYYFNDCKKRDVFKVSISFDGGPEELCFYFEKNKVIKRQKNKIENGKPQVQWSIYFDGDKEVYLKGKMDTIRSNEVEQAYYFLNLAFRYAEEKTCR